MNKWLEESLEIAQKQNYLDKLQEIYKLPPNKERDLCEAAWNKINEAYQDKDDYTLIKNLLELDLFPIKHSFVAYFRHDPSAIERNPETVREIAKILYNSRLEVIKARCKEPKETNRQIGPLFKNYLAKTEFGLEKLVVSQFRESKVDALLVGSDAEAQKYAEQYLGYSRKKGLDFLARIKGRHIIGEAKFLTDFGGHQNSQLEDALTTLEANVRNTDKILVLDGVLFIANSGKMYQTITQDFKDENIMSAVLLKAFIKERLHGTQL